MLIDELKDAIKNISLTIDTIKNYWAQSTAEDDFKRLHTLSTEENFWKNPDQAEILKSLQKIRSQRENYHTIINRYNDMCELIELFQADEEELKRLQQEIRVLAKETATFKINLMLGNVEDSSNCFFSINSGAGGTESQDWANMLLRMYIRFCERENLSATIIDYQAGENSGIKSATLFIKGKYAYGLLKSEQGIHRLVRISPFDANKRRHTSFAAVSVTAEVPEVEITIDPKDLRVDTYRAGGAGGQHVNKTESAVRITHIPSGLVTQCQNERSQIQNRETALKMLRAKLVAKNKAEYAAKAASIEKKKIEWGSQIRSYILHPYKLVKDHRTNLESPQPELILDGDLKEFIESYLMWSMA